MEMMEVEMAGMMEIEVEMEMAEIMEVEVEIMERV